MSSQQVVNLVAEMLKSLIDYVTLLFSAIRSKQQKKEGAKSKF